jgi:hypothetical protein
MTDPDPWLCDPGLRSRQRRRHVGPRCVGSAFMGYQHSWVIMGKDPAGGVLGTSGCVVGAVGTCASVSLTFSSPLLPRPAIGLRLAFMGVPYLHEGSRPLMQSTGVVRGAETRAGPSTTAASTTACQPPFKCQPPRQPPRRVGIRLRSPLPSPGCFGPSGESIEIPAWGARRARRRNQRPSPCCRHRAKVGGKSLRASLVVHSCARHAARR